MAIPTSVPLNVGSSVPPRPTDANSKYIAPTLKLKDVSDSLQFHQDRNSSSMNSSRGNLSKRFLHPMSLDAKEVNYKINVPNFANLPPLQLGSKFITDLNKIDSLTPSDLYYGETINKTETGLDNYYFDYDNGLSEFSRFEKDQPGMFPEIERSWIAIDNKLVLWNYKVPQSSFNQSSQFLTIDQIRHTILTVKLVKPKPGVFVPEVNYLLVVATTIDIHIFIIKYDSSFNNLEIFNPDLSISSQGLITNDIYFSGEGDGINIWRLDYSNKSSFIKNKCDKICLTKSGLSSVIPNKLPELLVQLEVDPERDILYSLSNKSIIRVYKLQPKQEQLHEASRLTPNQIFKSASSLFVDTANIKVFERFKVISIQHISPQESGAVQLIAITSNGCRILLKLGSSSTFGSLISSSFASNVPVINPELDSFTRNKQYLAQLVANQQKSQLLKNTKIAKVISPGVFICVKKTKKSDKLFIATANYGFLKKNNKLVEDAEFIKYGANDDTSFTYINDIIQLTPSMNATNTPNGYANVLASQYTKQPLRFALLTNFGIIIYQFKLTDQILKTLKEETIENFIEENGFEETCSTLFYLSCSYGHHNSNDLFKRKAQILFSPASHPTVDQVVLSDRFYGTCLLISRLFRECWNKNVFVKLPHIKSNTLGEIEVASVKEDNLLIKGLNIDKKQVEFFIGSIIVLIDFFVENGNSIQGLNAPNYSSDPSQFESEVCLRAEHIAFTSIIKSLNSMKEALSFLMVLIEEIQINQSNFNDIFKFLSLTNQVNLLSLSFKDLLLPNREVKNLIKDLLSSIINKNILKGGSIDLIASSLQGQTSEIKSKCLKNAVILFEEAHESLTLENIENSVNIMLDLEYYVGAVGLLLKLAHKVGSNPKIPNAQFDQINAHDNSKKNTRAIEDNKKRSQLFNLVFKILTSVDSKAIKITETNNQLLINEFIEVRDSAYESCFASQDKAFHYEFYQWFIDQGVSERLLEIDTPFILPFLEERSEKTLALSDLLWLYHSKREHYFEAASILYSLAISEFALNLNQRIEYLSRANGFCNCVCPPNLRQKMIQLSSVIQELFDVANVQLDILAAINSDSRISKENKDIATSALNFKILTISDLFNTYADPLGYYDLCLLIFKISDYKNTDDILKRWELFFEKIFHEFLVKNKSSSEAFYILVNKAFSLIGSRLSSNDLVFPIDELIKLISKYLQEAIEENPVSQKPPKGAIIDMFVKSGVGYDKLYYVIKSLIEHNTFEIYPGFTNDLKTNEMAYLIKNWYNSDKKLRELISSDKIRKLEDYSLEVDPISDLVKHGGVLF
ncbi:hypothetical protein G9P44_005361 [Scheffersomyces stipitis]|nr:hypothetical protein G9P44_005361 [Scheffersomyces stipitis]